MGAYNMDSHNMQRYVDARGFVRNEGDVQVAAAARIRSRYRSIAPESGRVHQPARAGLLRASHIAYGSIRMEPVFMVLGQSAATAACLAIDAGTTVQDVDYAKLRAPAARRPPGARVEELMGQ